MNLIKINLINMNLTKKTTRQNLDCTLFQSKNFLLVMPI
jgi:hypothetical protein